MENIYLDALPERLYLRRRVCNREDVYKRQEYTIKAIQQGKKVLCEKPMVGSAEELKRLIELAQSNRAGNIVGFNYRYSWENRTLYELMKKGVFGKIWTFYQRKGGNLSLIHI